MSTDESDPSSKVPVSAPPRSSLIDRFRKALGPALPAIVLDLADALSLTRYASPLVSFPVGFGIGIWLSLYYPFSWSWRMLIALGSGLYTLTPGTEAIPLATMLTCLGRFVESSPEVQMSVNNSSSDEQVTSAELSSSEVVAMQPPVGARSSRRGPGSSAICPECGSASLRYGEVAQRFYPAGKSIWAKGHELNAFVCMECGFVGHFLATSDLDQLRGSSQ